MHAISECEKISSLNYPYTKLTGIFATLRVEFIESYNVNQQSPTSLTHSRVQNLTAVSNLGSIAIVASGLTTMQTYL